ncbi:hypothetical protein [Kineococcus sp. SYSU DK005]
MANLQLLLEGASAAAQVNYRFLTDTVLSTEQVLQDSRAGVSAVS